MASRYTLEYLGLKKRNFNKYANMLKFIKEKTYKPLNIYIRKDNHFELVDMSRLPELRNLSPNEELKTEMKERGER